MMLRRGQASRRTVAVLPGLLVTSILLAEEPARAPAPALQVAPVTVEVYKLPDCGCCKAWIKYLQVKGFLVQVNDVPDDAARRAVQERFGVPDQLRSCHTATVEGYVLEGHVAAEEIRFLLKERPKWKGLFINGMPRGAPGMEGGRAEPYDVVAVDEQGQTHVFAHHEPATP